MTAVHISIVVALSAFGVSAECIFLGYRMFVLGAVGSFKLAVHGLGAEVGLESVAPGLALMAFGAALAAWTVHRLIGASRT